MKNKYRVFIFCIFIVYLFTFFLPNRSAADSLKERARTNVSLSETFRLENRTYPSLDKNSDAKKNFSFNMLKFQIEEKVSPEFSLNLSLQDYRFFNREPVSNSSISVNNFEINVLNMRFEKFLGCGKLKAIIGRQESVCKECRVMGIGNWIIGRIWDGVRFTYYDTPAETFDLYSFEVKRTAVDPPVQSRGMYYFNEMHGVEIYAMNKIDRNGAAGESSNGAVNNIDVKTFGYKQKIKLGRIFNFYSELAYQKGRYSSDEHRAHASHFELKTNTPFALSLEYNRASGDGDPADGRHETFDNLFPANYGKYGYMNYMSWQNMKEHSISISKSYRNDVDIKIGFHKFMLDSAKDSWYNGFLARMRSDPSGKSGTDIGREIDLIVTKKLPGNFNVEFGAAKFYSGDYIKHTQSADNSASDSVWTFFQISKKHSF